jgi:hypothetical protein
MPPIARQLLALCLLRIGPQDLPYSVRLTRALVLALAALEYAYAAMLGMVEPLPRVAVSMGMLLAAPWIVLMLRERRPRYAQTLAALAGSSLLFTLAFVPLAWVASGLSADAEPTFLHVVIGWFALLLLGWKLMVNAHIYRHALDWPQLPAMLLVVALFLIEFGVYHALFGIPGA